MRFHDITDCLKCSELRTPFLLEARHGTATSVVSNYLGCVPFGEAINGFLIRDLPDFVAELKERELRN